jgi:hypothetical protein
MRETDPGHAYVVDVYDGEPSAVAPFPPFMKRIGEGYPGNEPPAAPGTNCQEVLRVLIRRVAYLNGQELDQHNSKILNYLRASLWEFELRHAERRGRLEGLLARGREWSTDLRLEDRPLCVEMIPTCSVCGHVFCEEHPSA